MTDVARGRGRQRRGTQILPFSPKTPPRSEHVETTLHVSDNGNIRMQMYNKLPSSERHELDRWGFRIGVFYIAAAAAILAVAARL